MTPYETTGTMIFLMAHTGGDAPALLEQALEGAGEGAEDAIKAAYRRAWRLMPGTEAPRELWRKA